MVEHEAVKQIVQGVSKADLAAIVTCCIGAVTLIIGIVGYILKLTLKPLQNAVENISEKVEYLSLNFLPRDKLDLIIDKKIYEHTREMHRGE